jgi:hypothetical protein
MTDRILVNKLILDFGLFTGYSIVNYRTFVATGLQKEMCIDVTSCEFIPPCIPDSHPCRITST